MRILVITTSLYFSLWSSICTAQYYSEGNTVVDFENGVTWYKCTLGQTYNPDNGSCEGNAQRLNHAEIAEALKQAESQLGGTWRLPTRKELESLVCKRCDNPKIDKRYFPGTESEPYWTGQKNWISPRNYWSVNFMTGHTFGRFFPNQRLLAMIVQDNK